MAIYFGGKNNIYRSIINLIPQHSRFVELFAGSAAVSRHLARADESLVVELDAVQVRWLKARKELSGHRVVGADAFEILAQFGSSWGEETVVFADPPYPIKDRRDARKRYRCELDDVQHARLIELLLGLKARVLVCGHPWGTYARAFRDWKRHEFSTGLRSGHAGVECVWANYDDPYPLHDYRYFGENKRTRQDLRRRIDRQVQMFRAMDPHHRAAILGMLARTFAARTWQAPAAAADAGIRAAPRGRHGQRRERA